jgi:hypothetical protein
MMTLALLAALVLPGGAQESAVRRIQERFEAARPDEQRLAFYSLDWAMSLSEAKERARKERRPILLVLNTNITAGTNFFSGHT